MCKETHVFKWPSDGAIGHYLDIKNPNRYRPATSKSWWLADQDLFKWHQESGQRQWILEKIKPVVLENK